MSDVVKIKLYVGTGFSGADHEDIYEYPKNEWEAMTKEEQEDVLDELAKKYIWECIECSAWVMEDEE